MATINRRGNSWQLNWSENGEQQRVTLGKISPGEAEACRLAKELELKTGQRVFVAAELFDDFVRDYLEWHARKFPDSHFRVKQICEQCFGAFLGKSLADITRQDIDRWVSERETRVGHDRHHEACVVASETAAKELRTLKGVLNKAVEWGKLAQSPAGYGKGSVKAPKSRRGAPVHWYSRAELARLYSDEVEYAPVWRLIANAGLRRAEALHLKWEQVDLARGSIHVLSTEDERTKSGKWREIPMSAGAREALELLNVLEHDEYVLPRMTGPSLSRRFLRDAGRLGLKGSLHSLRHSYGAHQVMQGTPLRTLQELMGHASFVTTLRYAHIAKDHMREQAKLVSI